VLLSAIPISISGWGVRESAMVAGLTMVGVSPAAALATSVLLGLVSAIVGLVGGIVWLVSRDRKQFTLEELSIVEHEAKDSAHSIGAEVG
jgi:hypothetical protein